MGQVEEFVRQVKELNIKGLFKSICLTGGEPLLHPDIEKIMERMEELRRLGYVKDLIINSNTILESPESLKKYIINYSKPSEKPFLHNVAFLHPKDFSDRKVTYATCTHYRKNTLVLTYQGFSICCAADGYIRLFGMNDLIFDHIPLEFDLKGMDKICKHCPFGSHDILPLEKDMGLPISDIYKREAKKNRLNNRITKRFPERQI
jgi:hypothetical protein